MGYKRLLIDGVLILGPLLRGWEDKLLVGKFNVGDVGCLWLRLPGVASGLSVFIEAAIDVCWYLVEPFLALSERMALHADTVVTVRLLRHSAVARLDRRGRHVLHFRVSSIDRILHKLVLPWVRPGLVALNSRVSVVV